MSTAANFADCFREALLAGWLGVLMRTSKIQYVVSVTGLFIVFVASIYLALLAYDHSGLPTDYGFLAVVPVTLVWAVLRNRLKDAFKSVRR